MTLKKIYISYKNVELLQLEGLFNAKPFSALYLQAFIIKCWDLREESKFQRWEENLVTWSWKYFVATQYWLCSEGNLFQFQHVMGAWKKLNIVKCNHPSCWVMTFITEIQNCNWSEAKSSFDSSAVPESAYSEFSGE